MSVEFSNAYQEILLDNLVSIIKQNFIFQTQIKLAESTGKSKEEIQIKYNELLREYEAIKNYKVKAESNAGAHEEKSRLQSALNDLMKKKTGLEKEIEEKEAEIQTLKEYISKLEGIAPVSKLKKINPDVVTETKSVELPIVQDIFSKTTDGSSF